MSKYEEKFKGYTIEQKRKDLIFYPVFHSKNIETASDDEVIELHKDCFGTLNDDDF